MDDVSARSEKFFDHFSQAALFFNSQSEATSVPGVFVAGNIIKDVQLAIVAAAEGTRAAFGISRSLTREDFDRRATGVQRVDHPPVDDEDVARAAGGVTLPD